jgi:hypothetical protein
VKANRPATFYLPIKFDPTILPSFLRDYASYFLNLIHWRSICWQADENNFVRLKHDYLVKVIPKVILPDVRDALVGAGVVEWDDDYAIGKKCMGYRLAPGYRRTRRVVCTNEVLTRRIRRVNSKRERALTPTHRWLWGKLGRLAFDMDRAVSIIATLRPEPSSCLTISEYREQRAEFCQKLADGEHYFDCDRYGRVHTLLTSLDRELRCCLSVGGRPLVGLDLKNSQPLIVGMVARQFYSSKNAPRRLSAMAFGGARHPYAYKLFRGGGSSSSPPDVEAYVRECERGTFYESLMTPGEDRGAFKEKFYTEVLFGRNRYHSPLKKKFELRYPHVAHMLRVLKKNEYQRSAWVMQHFEASIFIHRICGRILREGPLLPLYTIHDSILTVPDAVGYVRSVILEEFAKLGVRPRLHKECYDGRR